MFVLIKQLVGLIYSFVVSYRLYTLLSFVYSYVIEELAVDGATIRPSKHAKNNKYTILILSSKAFRKDLECLVATNEFRMLRLPDQWQSRLIFQFYPEGFQKFLRPVVGANPDLPDYKYKKNQKEIREFLHVFLAKLYKRISIDCVISPHHRYVVDRDWGAVSTKMGIPHIMLPRDSQFASSPYVFNRMKELFGNGLPKFEGDHVIVQSLLDEEVYINSGYVSPERISSLGCPRMDGFIKKSKEKRIDVKKRRKKVVFLPFSYKEKSTFDLLDLRSYVKELQLFFLRFAIKFPEIDVVIKPKRKGLKWWKKEVMIKMIGDDGIESNKLLNLIIRDDIDIHSLFFESDIICGLNTSALLEAAVIGLPVIIPYFKDLQNPKYDERLFYRDAYDLFDIAKDVNELESIIIYRLNNPTIDETIMDGRKALFEEYVSSMKGDATERYVAMIKRVIAEKLSGQPAQRQ